jgi:hypothetical protein
LLRMASTVGPGISSAGGSVAGAGEEAALAFGATRRACCGEAPATTAARKAAKRKAREASLEQRISLAVTEGILAPEGETGSAKSRREVRLERRFLLAGKELRASLDLQRCD